MDRRQKGSGIISGAASAATSHEKLSGFLKTDRLQPVYTVCLYSGTDPWDGPRTLSDMMAFHPNDNYLRFLFDEFHTDLRQLFRAMNCRKDKQKLTELMGDKLYSHLNEDTWDAIAVMTDNAALLQNKEAFRNTYGNQEGFNMCQALQELMQDERNEGRIEGRNEGKIEDQKIVIRNMINRGYKTEDICAIAECSPAFVKEVETELALT